MAISIELLNNDNNYWRTIYNKAIAPIWYAVRQWFNIFCITVGCLYASVLFSMQHNIFPWYIAVPIAIGITWTYLSGLAYATAVTTASLWTTPMIIVGAVTDGLFGILYVLGRYDVIPEQPNNQLAVLLALAHIVPLIILVIIFTYCKKHYFVEKAQIEASERKRRIERDDKQRALEDQWRNAQLELNIAKDNLALERERLKLASAANVKGLGLKPCRKCGTMLNAGKYAASMRYGYCSACKPSDAK